ncbi:hypothetical protein QM012_004934 [Aureobasidium pullulans]|uniref:Zn(2)-C6 fungal-type domain-containing protein n=1 Tax=Aureobasidium pullulans TaxID=5580 RepID=A0ABR0T789_AURPU
MSGQACEPCSRRKVRCDKQQPCSNCKRRKQDQCTYPEAQPIDRIKKLESLVRSLGGDPNDEESRLSKRIRTSRASASASAPQRDAQDARDTTEAERGQPIMLEQDGQSYYVELRAWHSHLGSDDDRQNEHNHDVLMSRPLISRTKPNALKGLMRTDYTASLSSQHPSVQDANFLWDRFEHSANPLMKVDFDWALEQAASIERLSIQSLFSLMGLTIRNAEKLGIHRDGTLLGLGPAETESRRRLWWYLQHLDLALGVRCGTTPLTLMAAWDARIPLNIEDSDLNPEMKEPPPERRGLTSLSYCLWTYWIVSQQRDFFKDNKGKLGISWASNKTLSHARKNELLEIMEEGLNQRFLQYCDPIKPLDIIIQLTSRALICTMRMFTLHPMSFSGAGMTDEERHSQLMEAAIKTLEYNVALNSRPEIRRFHWYIDGYFQWHAFISVIVEVTQLKGSPKAQRIWDLLSDLYTYNKNLLELSEDRRKLHAAELIISAWKARHTADASAPMPLCVTILQPLLNEHRVAVESAQPEAIGPLEPVMIEEDLNEILGLEFQDIDWSFWAGME